MYCHVFLFSNMPVVCATYTKYNLDQGKWPGSKISRSTAVIVNASTRGIYLFVQSKFLKCVVYVLEWIKAPFRVILLILKGIESNSHMPNFIGY